MTIYARITTGDGRPPCLWTRVEMLGWTGFGADASVGHGAFEVDGTLVHRVLDLDDVPGANGFIALSTFQPTSDDPA